jgi:hypothetical protein
LQTLAHPRRIRGRCSAPRPEITRHRGMCAPCKCSAAMLNCSKYTSRRTTSPPKLAAWKKNADAIARRWPVWERLLNFHSPLQSACPKPTPAPNPLPPSLPAAACWPNQTRCPELTKQLTTALRNALGKLQDDLATAFQAGDTKLASSPVWNGRTDEQRTAIVAACQLTPPPKAAIGTEDEILAALRARTLTDRRNLLDAVPQRFCPRARRSRQTGHSRSCSRRATGRHHQDHR